MCEICRTKKNKVFWLDQYREMKEAAKKISETLKTTHPRIQIEIDEFKLGIIENRRELFERIFEIIKDLTVPRENSGGKYIEQNLFQ